MEKFLYYVVYTYDMAGHGCYEFESNGPLRTYQQILELAAQITKERGHKTVIILDWKRLQ